MDLKNRLLEAGEKLSSIDTQGLQKLYFENSRSEETAWLVFESKGDGDMSTTEQFAVLSMAFLLQEQFFEPDSLDNLAVEEFKELDVERAREIIACTPFKMTQNVAESLQRATVATAIYNDWDYRIYILSGPDANICFAWMTTA